MEKKRLKEKEMEEKSRARAHSSRKKKNSRRSNAGIESDDGEDDTPKRQSGSVGGR